LPVFAIGEKKISSNRGNLALKNKREKTGPMGKGGITDLHGQVTGQGGRGRGGMSF